MPPPPTGTCNIIDDYACKLFFGDLALRGRYFAKADIGDAYVKANRARAVGYMKMPDTVKEYDADGTEMVVRLVTPLWGETEAGFEWDYELHERLLKIGWEQCAGVPAMYFNSPKGDCRVIKIVDDLGISESDPEQAAFVVLIVFFRLAGDKRCVKELKLDVDIRRSSSNIYVKM